MKRFLKGLGQWVLAMLIVQVLVVGGLLGTGFSFGLQDLPDISIKQEGAIAGAFGVMIWVAMYAGSALGKRWEWL